MNPPLTRRSLSAVALAVLLGAVGLAGLSAAPDASHGAPRGAAADVEPAPETVRREVARRAAARTAQAAAPDAVEATGAVGTRADARAALVEEAAMAARNREERFATNVRDLRQAAALAAAEGRPEQAALMQRRADALADRAAGESGAE